MPLGQGIFRKEKEDGSPMTTVGDDEWGEKNGCPITNVGHDELGRRNEGEESGAGLKKVLRLG